MKVKTLIGLIALSTLVGCASYNAQPYTVLTDNQTAIKNAASATNSTQIALDTVTLDENVNPSLTCRAAGPVNPAPGKTVAQYIEEALKSELHTGGIYSPEATHRIKAKVTALGFSSVGSANWALGLHLASSSLPEGYDVNIRYPFSASFFADYACRDVAEAFAPAVQKLVNETVTAPQFMQLIQPPKVGVNQIQESNKTF
jgi:hypothetical protein